MKICCRSKGIVNYISHACIYKRGYAPSLSNMASLLDRYPSHKSLVGEKKPPSRSLKPKITQHH